MAKKERNEALELVGRKLYGEMWIGELGTPEWKAGRRYGAGKDPVSLPADAKRATYNARACFRSWASDLQYGQVFLWLREQQIDPSPGGFSSAKFATWFRKNFGGAPGSPTEARVNAVKNAIQKHGRPGRGGAVKWERFCDLVRRDCRQTCDDRTIKRDVKSLA